MPDWSRMNLWRDLKMAVDGTQFHEALGKVYPPNDGSRLLEPGCGSGKLGLWYAINGCRVTLLDIDEEMVAYARRLYHTLLKLWGERLSVRFKVGDVHELPYPDRSFDFVFNEGVAEHWTGDPRQTMFDEMARVAKGKVAVVVPNAAHPGSQKVAREHHHTYKGMPEREVPLTRTELRERLVAAGLTYEGIEPIGRMIIGWGSK